MPQSIDDHKIYILNACDWTSVCCAVFEMRLILVFVFRTVHGATTGFLYEKTRANFDYVLQISVCKIIF